MIHNSTFHELFAFINTYTIEEFMIYLIYLYEVLTIYRIYVSWNFMLMEITFIEMFMIPSSDFLS